MKLSSKLLERMLDLPPAKWREFVEGLTVEERRHLGDAATQVATFVCRAAGYADAVGLTAGEAITDEAHDAAVKRSNACVTAFRKASRFTYPEGENISF